MFKSPGRCASTYNKFSPCILRWNAEICHMNESQTANKQVSSRLMNIKCGWAKTYLRRHLVLLHTSKISRRTYAPITYLILTTFSSISSDGYRLWSVRNGMHIARRMFKLSDASFIKAWLEFDCTGVILRINFNRKFTSTTTPSTCKSRNSAVFSTSRTWWRF